MSERLLLSMPAPGESQLHWLHWDESSARAVDSGAWAVGEPLAELGERFAGLPCYVVVPGELVSWQRVVVPKGGKVGLAALPYQLEEHLCSDLESLHLACGSIRANEECHVLVADRRHMEEWQALLAASGLKVKAMLPDYAMLPANVVVVDEQRAIAHVDNAATAMQRQNLLSWWQLAGGDKRTVQLYCQQGLASQAELGEFGQVGETFDHRLAAIAARCQPWPINLLSGDYALRDEASSEGRWLRWPLLLLVTLLGLHWLQLGLQVADNRRQIEHYEQGMVAIYRDTFPGARVVNARSQMRSQLNALNAGGASESVFLPWLERIARASKGESALRIQQMNYDGKVLKLLVDADGYDAVDRWVAALATQGFTVSRGAFGQQDKGITGQLELREARP